MRIDPQDARRITCINTIVQPEKSGVYCGQGAVSGRDRRCFLDTDGLVHRVDDVDPDLGQVEPEQVHIDLEPGYFFCHLGILDPVMDGFEILGKILQG